MTDEDVMFERGQTGNPPVARVTAGPRKKVSTITLVLPPASARMIA
jgi:hypothetical protein